MQHINMHAQLSFEIQCERITLLIGLPPYDLTFATSKHVAVKKNVRHMVICIHIRAAVSKSRPLSCRDVVSCQIQLLTINNHGFVFLHRFITV